MTKKRIIILSVLLGILALIIILFGAVFCLRKISINTLNAEQYPLTITQTAEDGTEQQIPITDEMLISASNLKRGRSIFGVDKEQAKQNIEQAYPSIKVVQINTVSAIQVQIVVRARVGVYYTSVNFSGGSVGYYILDEDLVILDTLLESEGANVPDDYIYINIDNEQFKSDKEIYDQLSTSTIQSHSSGAFNSICSAVRINNGQLSQNEADPFVERETISQLVQSVSIEKADVDLSGYEELAENIYWLTITTREGQILKILRPDKDLTTKVNYSFSAIPHLTNENNTIVCRYDENGDIYLYQTQS